MRSWHSFHCKTFFGLLGWYSTIGSDAVYRKRLDGLWVRLQDESFFDVAHRTLVHLVNRVRLTFSSRLRAAFLLIIVAFGINLGSLPLAAEALGAGSDEGFEYGRIFLRWFDTAAGRNGTLTAVLGVVALAILGAAFDLLSAFVTWWLLKRAALAQRLGTIFLHLVADFALAALAMTWSLVIVLSAAAYLLGDFWYIAAKVISEPNSVFQIDEAREMIPWLGFSAVMGMSACFPTAIHLSLGVATTAAYFTPNRVQRVVHRIVFLVTTDSKPVLSQLGNVAGAIAGLLTAVAGALAD